MNKLKTLLVAGLMLLSQANISANAQSKNIFYADQLVARLTQLADTFPAEVGMAFSIEGETFETHNNLHFPLLSVVKFYQALAICNRLGETGIPIYSTIRIEPEELMKDTWSPMLEYYGKGGKISIDKLLEYSLVQSDNNACNILFDRVLGTEYTEKHINGIVEGACSIIADEKMMHEDPTLCYDNWSNPVSAVKLMEHFYQKRNEENFRIVWNFMSECNTGENRIPKYLHDYATVIHKTGTGPVTANGDIMAVNDVACVVLPNGRHFCLAVFIKDAQCSMARCEELIATMAQKCFEYFY